MNMDNLTINTLRILSAEAVEKANSGHPGLPLGAAPMAYTLWGKVMNHDSKNPNWINRDRFILSAGHGSALLYSLLHVFDYGITKEDLENFRQIDSKTPGHPEYRHTVGVETTTGPLGQGLANSVGMAMAEAHLAATFNTENEKIIDHYTYVICGDGDMMEGVGYEATSLAGTLGLGKLIVLYDSNSITIEGGTDLAFREDVMKRFDAQGWETFEVEDGNDVEKIYEMITKAKKNLDKPSLIKITTEIGFGSPSKQGKSAAHGAPLGADDLKGTKEYFNWTEEDFVVPKDVKTHMEKVIANGHKSFKDWEKLYEGYKKNNPELAKKFESYFNLELPMDYLESDEFWNFDKGVSTRVASGMIINRLSEKLPNLIGGSADLAPSNNTYMKNREDFSKENYKGTNLRFGVREHAMAAAINGLYLHGGLRPYGGTFFIFSDYMKPSMRLSALMELPVTYILTHDSIGVGEDGPTHQPIEQSAMLRALPNFNLFRPCDARETAAAWYSSLTSKKTPTGLALTRQDLPLLEGTGKDAIRGGYIVKKEKAELQMILLASGSEVQLVYEVADLLEAKGIGTRVVSMPCFSLFEKQSKEYKEEVLPKSITKRLAVEAGSELGWYKYVGLDGDVIAMEGFGASGPGEELFKKFGFTVENVLEKALKL
ncbi:transketolase [Tissierella creatinophila]|uniref:Transketolase n=1 Tax=Tissierella creatinophila DSM 6911 TaxID=1123403 RepID=A0A1U7M8Y2_TISCR|nr:transketolase [Tissierella creatinophila]OLS03658.1 transketolase [Tissierella creatinophila DSM 6911]